MKRGCARLGDTTQGICSDSSHRNPIKVNGKIITASSNVIANNKQVAIVGDLVKADCGHTSHIITGSTTNATVNGKLIARLGDKIKDGPYEATIITASTDIFIDSP
jgi:uncharacterized Zn-binding protein involved in type VI secretion